MEDKDTQDLENEDVEAHSLADRPKSESPTHEMTDEPPDVEGHALLDRPKSERPKSE